MKTRTFSYYSAILLPIFVFISFNLCSVISHFPQYDDAYNATIAKNLANGFGYTSSFDTLRFFNPEVTTGPSLVFPAALLIIFFGTKYWIPAFTTLAVSSILLFFILKFFFQSLSKNSLKSWNNQCKWEYFFVLSLCLCLFYIPEVNGIQFIGELPAALFVCLGAIIIFNSGSKLKDIFCGGFILGLSITTKQISLVLIFPIFLIWTVFLIIDAINKKNSKNFFFIFMSAIIGIIMPSFFFEFYKIIGIGFTQYLKLKHSEAIFFKAAGSGINQIISTPNLILYGKNNFINNLQVLQNQQGKFFILFVFFISSMAMFFLSIVKLKNKKNISSLEKMTLALIFSVSTLLFWWLFISYKGYYRTVSPAIYVAFFSIISSLIVIFGEAVIPMIVQVVVFWVLVSPINWATIISTPVIPKPLLDSTENTSIYLSEQKSEGKKLLGCGWWANRRLEYFMPQTLNFNQCFSNISENSILVIDTKYWNWENSDEIMKVEQQCSQLIFEDLPYKVFKCR